MAEALNIILLAALVVVQFVAAFFTYKIYQYNRLAKPWLAVVVAFLLMAVHPILNLLNELEIFALTGGMLWANSILLPLLVGVSITWGVWSMSKQFESFDVIEKNAAKKIAETFKKL